MHTWGVVATAAGGLVAVLAVLGTGWKGLRGMWRTLRKVNDFLEDWAGEEARPGVAARPGVMERLTRIEHEVTTNSGGSLKDAVTRIDERVAVIERRT